MTAHEVAERVGGRLLVDSGAEATTFYAGDFLSRVMGKAPADSVWITVMNNVNVAGVAVLAEIRIIVVCEGSVPAEQLVQKCEDEGIALITSDKGVYECCRLIG